MSNIIQFEHNGVQHLVVTVPSMAFGFDIQNYTTEVELIYMLNLEEIDPELAGDETLVTVKLPNYNWKIATTLSDITEEQADEMVDSGMDYLDFGYLNYEGDEYNFYKYPYDAIDSLKSRIRSLGGNTDDNLVILKEVK